MPSTSSPTGGPGSPSTSAPVGSTACSALVPVPDDAPLLDRILGVAGATRRGTTSVITSLPFLPRDVVAFEPRQALDGGDDGLQLQTSVVERSTRWLRPGGWLLVELGGDQAGAVAGHMGAAGFVDVSVLIDEEGDDRVMDGRRPDAAGRPRAGTTSG